MKKAWTVFTKPETLLISWFSALKMLLFALPTQLQRSKFQDLECLRTAFRRLLVLVNRVSSDSNNFSRY